MEWTSQLKNIGKSSSDEERKPILSECDDMEKVNKNVKLDFKSFN